MTDEERFESKYEEDENGCWIWHGTFSHSNTRYSRCPNFSYGGKTISAVRWIWELVNGPLPEKRLLLSTCGNHTCVNPLHRRVSSGKSIGQSKPPLHGPKLPPKSERTLLQRMKDSALKHQRKRSRLGSTCIDCGDTASIGASRCKPCWDKHRRTTYCKEPEEMLRHRYRAWKERKAYTSGTKQGSTASVRETG